MSIEVSGGLAADSRAGGDRKNWSPVYIDVSPAAAAQAVAGAAVTGAGAPPGPPG